MIQSSGNVLLEEADKVLACGSFTYFQVSVCYVF